MLEHKNWIKDVYDRAAASYGEKGCAFFDHFGERLTALASLSEGDNILDVATGKGAVLLPAAKTVGPQGTATGVDLSPKMIENAAKRIVFPWVRLHQMDAEQLLFDDHSFDVVFCAFALFFFPNITQALTEFRRVLKPTGKIALSTFKKRPDLELWICERVKDFGISYELAKFSLNRIPLVKEHMERAGFTRIEIYEETKVFWHENAEEWWDSLWTHGIRSRLEQLSARDLQTLKDEALMKAGAGKVSEERQVIFAIAN